MQTQDLNTFFAAAVANSTPTYDPSTTAEKVRDMLKKSRNGGFKKIPTGFNPLDNALNGGILPKSLVNLTAAPRQGKTSLFLQIADNLAGAGHDVIYFNLETDSEMMYAKSISRLAFLNGNRITVDDIMDGYRHDTTMRDIIDTAAEDYITHVAPHILYNPPDTTNDLETIVKWLDMVLAEYAMKDRPAPIVFVDYLHMLRFQNTEVSETLKNAVYAFKQYAMHGNTIVFTISASNRQSNTHQQTLESGRDTSNLEYTADYQLALDRSEASPDKRPAPTPSRIPLSDEVKRVRLKLLKVRFGKTYEDGIPLNFYAPYNYFAEKGQKDHETNKDKT